MPPARRGNTIYKRNDARLTEIPYETLSDTLLSLNVARSWISEIDCARLPKSTTWINATECPFLARVLNLDQLPNLEALYVSESRRLRSLSPLPNSLKELHVTSCTNLTSLPPLVRTSLEFLIVCETKFRTLPDLPDTLRELRAQWSKLETLPFLPDSLTCIVTTDIKPTESIPARPASLGLREYAAWLRERQRRDLRKEKFDALHESLIAATWHPSRFEAWCLDEDEKRENASMMGV